MEVKFDQNDRDRVHHHVDGCAGRGAGSVSRPADHHQPLGDGCDAINYIFKRGFDYRHLHDGRLDLGRFSFTWDGFTTNKGTFGWGDLAAVDFTGAEIVLYGGLVADGFDTGNSTYWSAVTP